ncbi:MULTISPECIES: hypothetical protein [Polyangium]|uniref:ABC transporter substrate-binding protein n=2 Tax=Polyangium TaxID=55 RepID=A0A4U1IP79_9BACT|nr:MULTISPECIES: hypothetical protein [Polyangium]MDI1436756.1 hypothetical protein [Polyangium sorediatum]TKC95887.1 hypothetical protein E8A74_46170 [Polyangium fumosum]
MDRRTSLGVVAGLAGALVLAGADAQGAKAAGAYGMSAPVTGSVVDVFGHVTGQLAGTVTVEHFAAQSGQLVANGKVTARLTDLAGNVMGTVSIGVAMGASITHATCTLLELELGPLSLSALGLQIDLSRVVLVLTANAGGGRLGQLLCTFADALGGGGMPPSLVDMLNDVLVLFAR